MYIASEIIQGARQYFIRQSILLGEVYVSQQLMELGSDPSEYIVYPGGHSFYVHENVEEHLNSQGCEWHYQDLENIFWPFVRPDIKRSIDCFRRRESACRKKTELTDEESAYIRNKLHIIDKRRYNYLRSGELDQTQMSGIPEKFYRNLTFKSRDELEQLFMAMETRLDSSEFSLYVYSFMHLRRFFTEISAGRMPQALNQDKLEQIFIREICHLNEDRYLWQGVQTTQHLHPYLLRYVFMFFDFPFGPDSFYNDFFNYFYTRSRQKFGKTPHSVKKLHDHEISEVMGVSKDELSGMSKAQVTRLFRRQAMKMHPDRGGDHDKFIQLMEAYQNILNKKI